MFLGVLAAWMASAAVCGDSALAAGSSPAKKNHPEDTRPAAASQGETERPSAEDEELIKNLDLIESLDVLNAAELLDAADTTDTPEEEF
jgi:hypothetical protein